MFSQGTVKLRLTAYQTACIYLPFQLCENELSMEMNFFHIMRVEQCRNTYYNFTFNKTSIQFGRGLTKQSLFENGLSCCKRGRFHPLTQKITLFTSTTQRAFDRHVYFYRNSRHEFSTKSEKHKMEA